MQITRAFTDNPIFQAEAAHQGRDVPRRRRWLLWLLRFILYLSFLLAFILVGIEFYAALTNAPFSTTQSRFTQFFSLVNLLPVTTALVLHFSLMLQTLARSANSIARERQSNNWDTLVLTGIDSRRIVRGKWWATVRHMWSAYVKLGILRAAVALWYMAESSHYFYSSIYFGMQTPPEMTPPPALNFLLAGLFIFVLTMLNLAFTAACGVSAISARSRSAALILGRAIATRLLVLVGLVVVGVMTLGALGLWRIQWLSFPLSWVFGTLLDNGVNMAGSLVSWRFVQFSTDSNVYWLSTALIVIGLYALLTWLMLRLAQWQATRQNALPPLRTETRE